MKLVDQIIAVHESLDSAGIPHAFGGALALAFCSPDPRATLDIDCNVFVDMRAPEDALAALPQGVVVDDMVREQVRRDGQVRIRWDDTPLDLFFDTTPFHRAAARRVAQRSFAGRQLPFLSCHDVAVFKAFFSRGKDWVDIETMVAGGLDLRSVIGDVVLLLGGEDERVERLAALCAREDEIRTNFGGPDPIFRPTYGDEPT